MYILIERLLHYVYGEGSPVCGPWVCAVSGREIGLDEDGLFLGGGMGGGESL